MKYSQQYWKVIVRFKQKKNKQMLFFLFIELFVHLEIYY